MMPAPSAMDLGAALSRLEGADPEAVSVVRAYLAAMQEHDQDARALDRLIDVAVHPVWRSAVAATAELSAVRKREAEARHEEARAALAMAKAYDDRTKLWQDAVLPKVIPILATALVAAVGGFAAWLGVPLPIPQTAP